MPLRLSSKYWAEHIGRPYQPPETFPNYSYINFLKKPRPYGFFWEIWGLGSHRLLLWGDPDFVRRTASTLTLSDSLGFEIDAPLAQAGYGNRPGKWGIFTAPHADRVFWDHDFERYWLFYMLWGRLTFDPTLTSTIWEREFKRRFGDAGPEALEAYQTASRVLSEIISVHMPDPNMYVWPEINPGGLIDVYRQVYTSDWRYAASPTEAVRNRIESIPSAKQTPLETAALLRGYAQSIDDATGRAASKLGEDHREWSGTRPDFRVLAHLARYHAS
ncbi:MAG: hypothetical protein GY953_00055, partial [bacterium]|nr:hypothetical protein [bacterium]